ncbi:MAG TPA: serine/threonine-protein kinase [Gemmata sp.]|nr:serine/threonine-protein kinase [Gemmata sp.]
MTDETIFATALDKADPAERADYLETIGKEDPAQRKRIEVLLAAHEKAVGFLERPPVAPAEPEHAPTRAFRGRNGEAGDGPTRAEGENPDEDIEDALSFLEPPGRPDSLGRLGHYEVLEVLGRGGFGIVYRAFDEVLQRVVAVKVLSPSMAATSPARKRFIREAQSAAPIQHENVVRVHAVGETPLPYLVMEFISGETLQQRLDRTGPLEATEVVRIGRQVAEGLAAAHERGLIHRDIKPSNILIENGTFKARITDFGLARAADDAILTRSGVVAGTPMYMAPEQARGETLDHRADLFSLGSVMYALLTGHPPFRAETTLAVLKRVAEDAPRPIREVIPEVPEWLCRIVEKLHAKNPAERYQSAKEVAEVLADCEKQLQTHRELKDFARIPAVKQEPAPARRRGRLKWAALAALIILTFGGLWFGRAALLYASNRGELELQPQEGLVSIIVLQNDDGVFDDNRLDPAVTDWLSMKKPQKLKLPPGKYQLNASLWPAGSEVSLWEVTTSDLFGRSKLLMPKRPGRACCRRTPPRHSGEQ